MHAPTVAGSAAGGKQTKAAESRLPLPWPATQLRLRAPPPMPADAPHGAHVAHARLVPPLGPDLPITIHQGRGGGAHQGADLRQRVGQGLASPAVEEAGGRLWLEGCAAEGEAGSSLAQQQVTQGSQLPTAHHSARPPTCTTGQNTPDSSSSPLLRFMPKKAAGMVAVTAPREMMLRGGMATRRQRCVMQAAGSWRGKHRGNRHAYLASRR